MDEQEPSQEGAVTQVNPSFVHIRWVIGTPDSRAYVCTAYFACFALTYISSILSPAATGIEDAGKIQQRDENSIEEDEGFREDS